MTELGLEGDQPDRKNVHLTAFETCISTVLGFV